MEKKLKMDMNKDKQNGLKEYDKGKDLMNLIKNDEKHKIRSYIRELNLEKAIDSNNENRQTLAALKRIDKEDLSDGLEMIIDYFANNTNNKGNIEYIIEVIADEITVKYYFFTFDEVCYVLKRGVLGYYKNPQQYSSQNFDFETVLNWFHAYDIGERANFVERNRKKENNSLSDDLDSREMYMNGKHNKSILDKIEMDREKEKKKELQKRMDFHTLKSGFFASRIKD